VSTGILTTADEREWVVLSANIVFPYRGVWTARFEVDADEDDPLPIGKATLILAADNEGEPIELVGTIQDVDATTAEGRATAMLVAGNGTLTSALLDARTYQQAPLEVPLSSIITDAIEESGEVLDDDVAVVGFVVSRWHRVKGITAAKLLDRLAERYGFTWRMTDDGLAQLAIDEWLDADIEAAGFFFEGPEDAIERTIAGSVARASLRPGTVVRGRRIEDVVYTLDETGLRVLLRWGDGNVIGGFRGDHEKSIHRALPMPAYHGFHSAIVRRQNANGTLDLDAEDPQIGGITEVPYRPGIVNCRLVITEGKRMLLGFQDGDESKPFALTLDAMTTAGKAVARVDDSVRCGTISFVASPDANGGIGSIAISYTPPGGLAAQSILLPDEVPISFNLSGLIRTGSQEVFIRGNS